MYDIDAVAAANLIINQNYDAGWRISEGRGNISHFQGLLAVSVPSGHQRLAVSYRDRAFRNGAAGTLIALAILTLLIISETRSARRPSGLTAPC